jgi:propanol-preferring alcohol dehydrogenase
MKAMLLRKVSSVEEKPLELVDLASPVPRSKQLLVRVTACGICHTELDEIEGRVSPSRFPGSGA